MHGNRVRLYRIAMMGLLVVAILSWATRVSGQGASRVTADQINAGYDRRRSVVLEALRKDPGGNLWHAASKGLAALYSQPVAPEHALIQLSNAAASDPRCAEYCGPGECGDGTGYWSLPLLIRAYYTFAPGASYENGTYAGRLPSNVADKIRGFYRSYLNAGAGQGYGEPSRCACESSLLRYDSPRYAYIAPSDNHSIIQASTILLATQMLRKESPETARLYEHWRAWWNQFLDVLARRGFWETASPTYVERHLAPLYNVYDFVEDPLLKKKVGMLLDWYWAEIAQELLNGVRGGAKARVYWIDEGDRGTLSAANDAMYAVFYLYFGANGFEDRPLMPHGEMYSAIFVGSSYRPSDVILELGANPEARGSYEIKEKRKGSCFFWDQGRTDDQPYNSRRYAYVTPDYILGSFQSDADKQFMPLTGQKSQLQNSLVFATTADARISWGEMGCLGSGQVNVFQHKNVVIASKVSHPELRLSYQLPAAGVLDLVQDEDGWVFVQEGSAYAALKLVHNEVLIIEAARAVDFGHDWNRFKGAILQALVLSRIDDGYLQYTATSGDVLYLPLRDSAGSCRYSCNCSPADDRLPKVNGRTVDWKNYGLFDSPYVRSGWDSGLVEVTFGTRKLVLDWRDPANPVKAEAVSKGAQMAWLPAIQAAKR